MSTTTSVTGSSNMAYATQIAQAATLKRGLYGIGSAIESGDLTGAGSKLDALIKANPQYATSSASSTAASDPINTGFKAVSDAIANNDSAGAKAAWAQLKTDLGNSGIKISDGTADTAQLLAENQSSLNQSLLSAVFGGGSHSSMLTTLLGSGGASSSTDSVSSTISSWLTYQATGVTSSSTDSSGGILNTIV